MRKLLSPKRTFAMLLAVMMCFATSATAFAAEPTATDKAVTQTAETKATDDSSTNLGIMPRDVETLYTLNGLTFQGPVSIKVYPTKGRNLKLILNNQGQPVKVSVTKNGGWWPSKSFTVNTVGSATYDLINNCNGEPYTITFESNGGLIYGSVVQTQYL